MKGAMGKKKGKKLGKKKYWMGIDLGGTKMLAGVFKKDFKLIGTVKAKVQPAEGEKVFLKTLKETVLRVLDENKISLSQVAGIGAGCPGIMDTEKGRVEVSPNIPFLKNYPLAKTLSKMLGGVPVVLSNDVNAGLYGEQQFGAAHGHQNVVGIFLGTGIGGALIFGGKLYEGSGGGAGEIGHMQMEPNGPQCGCGQRGCLEALAGRVAIAAEAAVLASKQKSPHLFSAVGTDISKIKSGVLAKAIAAGDKALLQLIEQKSKLLGIAMANLVNVLNPELIVLGGGLIEALSGVILPASEKSMRHQAMPDLAKDVKVAAAKLGDHAIIQGAAKMALDYNQGEL